jgi:CelD/BcsL family acetyltransferase involved in cellulose biosynthesis
VADLLYMSTYQPTVAQFSPSHLLLAEIARMAVAEGVRVIELGRGDEPYKFSLGARPRYLREVILVPHALPVD